jgi:hypothetical protein
LVIFRIDTLCKPPYMASESKKCRFYHRGDTLTTPIGDIEAEREEEACYAVKYVDIPLQYSISRLQTPCNVYLRYLSLHISPMCGIL